MFINIDGITNANISKSKYLLIFNECVVDDFITFWIFNPKIYDEVPIKTETTVEHFL